MKEKYKRGLVLDPSTGELKPVSRGQYIQQWLYGVLSVGSLFALQVGFEEAALCGGCEIPVAYEHGSPTGVKAPYGE